MSNQGEDLLDIMHLEYSLTSFDGTKIFYQGWMPADDNRSQGVLAIVHGYAEHGGRYAHVGRFFAERGFHVFALDHRSHGRSDGKETFFRSVDHCIEDVDAFINRAQEQAPGRPTFVLAHSMGGLITAGYVIKKHPKLHGVLFSGAAVKIGNDISPMMIKLSGILGKLTPRLKTIVLDGNSVSRDPEEVAKYNADPLNYRGGIPAATGAALNHAMEWINASYGEFTLPVRVMYGTADSLADPEGSRALFAGVASHDKVLVPYEGLYHEILNEPEKNQIMEECLDWIKQRL